MLINIVGHIAQSHRHKKSQPVNSSETEVFFILPLFDCLLLTKMFDLSIFNMKS